MKKIDILLLIGCLGLITFVVGIIFAILSFTNDISIYFSLCFVILAFILIIVAAKSYRIKTLKDMDDYINKHSVIKCPKCHAMNDLDANYCKNCGKKLHN